MPFAKIVLLNESIAEVLIHEGVELDANMVELYHEFLLTHLKSPFSILVNKVNSYTYSFEAQIKLGTLTEINAMAVVAYNQTAKVTTDYLASTVPRVVEWNLKIFSHRDDALQWLFEQQKNVNS